MADQLSEIQQLALNNHPSTKPEYKYRGELYDAFEKVLPEVEQLLGKSTYQVPLPGYERAWRIIFGVNVEGKMFFMCHIAEGFSTGTAYNSADTNGDWRCPVLLHGEPFHIRTDAMDIIRKEFPQRHQDSGLQYQMCLEMEYKAEFQNDQVNSLAPADRFVSLLKGEVAEINTAHLSVRKMQPRGSGETLSFETNRFYSQIWTHQSRKQVIKRALREEKEKDPRNEKRFDLYFIANKLEEALSKSRKERENSLKKLRKENIEICSVADLEGNIKVLKDKIEKFKSDNRTSLPKDYVGARNWTYKKIMEALGGALKKAKSSCLSEAQSLEMELSTKEKSLEKLQTITNRVKELEGELKVFKSENCKELPKSYLEATFQIAIEVKLSDGSDVYKQYNGEKNMFESGSEVKSMNAVHNVYLNINI